MKLSRLLLAAVVLPLAACSTLTDPPVDPDAAAHLTFQLIPSGNPDSPLGVLLSWEVPSSGRANSFNVYGRNSTSSQWDLRATTTSTSFHDIGVPQRQYYIGTRDLDGQEIAQSQILTIDLVTARLPAPQGLISVSLNGAIQLAWSSNAVDASHGTFDHYIVYSTSYDVARSVCTTDWAIEGSTVADAFYAGNLTNGESRCFAVSAVTQDGHESSWSDQRLDTPRLDARNAFVYNSTARPDSAGFVFFDDVANKAGVVGASSRTDLDFRLERHTDGTLWLTPARTSVTMMAYASTRVEDLTSIDRAPSSGYSNAALEALPGNAYVFRIMKPDGVHFAAARVAFKTDTYVVFDWSYQTAPGNAELNRIPMP